MSGENASKGALSWTDWRGKAITRETNKALTLSDFKGTPGHALLLVAANRHLSGGDLIRLLSAHGIERSQSWVYRRRWLFSQPGVTHRSGHPDGRDAQAIAIMQANTTRSIRQLVQLLAEHRIIRGRDWVMRNRCG